MKIIPTIPNLLFQALREPFGGHAPDPCPIPATQSDSYEARHGFLIMNFHPEMAEPPPSPRDLTFRSIDVP